MTETEELRGGLRELGVQYQACGDSFTMWKHDGKTATYAEYPEGGKLKAFVTPAQAIAATLGRGTCRRVRHDGDAVFEYCSECGGMLARWLEYDDGNAHFCPSCGKRVVES